MLLPSYPLGCRKPGATRSAVRGGRHGACTCCRRCHARPGAQHARRSAGRGRSAGASRCLYVRLRVPRTRWRRASRAASPATARAARAPTTATSRASPASPPATSTTSWSRSATARASYPPMNYLVAYLPDAYLQRDGRALRQAAAAASRRRPSPTSTPATARARPGARRRRAIRAQGDPGLRRLPRRGPHRHGAGIPGLVGLRADLHQRASSRAGATARARPPSPTA